MQVFDKVKELTAEVREEAQHLIKKPNPRRTTASPLPFTAKIDSGAGGPDAGEFVRSAGLPPCTEMSLLARWQRVRVERQARLASSCLTSSVLFNWQNLPFAGCKPSY